MIALVAMGHVGLKQKNIEQSKPGKILGLAASYRARRAAERSVVAAAQTADVSPPDGSVDLRERILGDGIVTVPGLLTAAEVTRMNKAITDHLATRGSVYRYGLVQANAAVEVPELNWVYTHPKVISAFRQLFGRNDFVFTGHSDIHQNMGFGWHKDDGANRGGYFTAPYFVDGCEVYKVGFYMGDHSTDGNGFYMKRGSQKFEDLEQGSAEYVPSRPGDAVFFDVRLTHRGKMYDYVEKLLLIAGSSLHDKTGASQKGRLIREAYQRARGVEPKRSMFFTFGAPNRFTDEFTQRNMDRQLLELGGSSSSKIGVGLLHELQELGVKVPDILI